MNEKDIKKAGYQQQVEQQAKENLIPEKDLSEQATEQAVNPFYSFSPDVQDTTTARPALDASSYMQKQSQNEYQIKHAESPEMKLAAAGTLKDKIDPDANRQDRNKNVQKGYLADFIKEQGQSIIESEAGQKALAGVSDKKEYASRLRRLISDAYRASDHYSEATKQIDYLNLPYEEKERLHKEKIQGNVRSQLEEMTNDVSSLYKDAVGKESQDDLSKITEGSLIQRAMKANMYAQKGVIGANTTQQARQLSIANKYLHEANNLIRENDKKDGNKVASAARAFRDKAFDLDNWTYGTREYIDNAEIKDISERFERGEKLTEAEEKLMDSLAINLATNLYFDEANRGYQWGSIAGESLPFMVEFMLNPVAGAGKGITKAIGKYGLKKFGSKAAQRAMRAVGAVAGDLASASALTATSGVFNTANEIERRMSGDHTFKFNEQTGNVEYAGIEGKGEGLFTAISKGIGSQLIEYFSEMGGERFGEVAGLAGLSTPGKWLNNKYNATMVGKAFSKMQGSSVYKTMRGLEKRAQWSGTLGEYLEEAYGTVLNSIFIGDESISDLADVEQQVDTFMGLLLSGGAMSGMRTVGYATDRINTAVKLNSLNSKMPDYIDNWEQVKNAIGNMTIGERSQLITDLSISDNNDLSLGARKNLADYVARLTYQEAMTSTEEEIRAQDKAKAEEQGVNLYHKAVQDRRATALVKAKMEADALFLQKHYIDLKLKDTDEGGGGYWTADYGLKNGLITQEEYNTYKAYDNAKARWTSFEDQLYKEVEDFVQPQVEQMAKHGVHEDSEQVIQINLGTEFEPDFQFVKRGNIVTAEDGGIDFSKSDEIIYITKEGGGLQQVSTRDILSQTPNKTTLKDFEQELRNKAQSEIVDPLIDKLEQKVRFSNGEQVEYRDEKGNAHVGTVTNASDNIVIVTDEAGESKAMTNDDLANSLINEQVAGLQARDEIEVYIDGEAYIATVDHVIDGVITLDIPTAPDVANRFMDVTAEEMEILLNPNNKEQTAIDEFEQAEIKALEEQSNTSNQSEIEAKKAKIDKINERRREELAALPRDVLAESAPLTLKIADERINAKYDAELAALLNEQKVTPEQQAESLQNDIDVPSGDKEVSANNIETSETESKADFPRDGEGNIDYKSIETDEMFLDALKEDFKDTPNEIGGILDDYKALAQKKVTNAKKKQDPIARRKAVAQAETEVKRWEKMKFDYMSEKNKQYVEEQSAKNAGMPTLNEQREEKREQEALVNAGEASPTIAEKWNSKPKHAGLEDTIMLASNEAIEGTYMLVEADAPTASHNPEAGFSKSEGFPTRQDGKTVNDRDYEKDKDAQAQVQLRAQNYNQKAIQDVPVVSAEGVVYSGNDRTMASQIAARQGTDKAYTDYLAKNAQRYGFTQEQLDSMDHPRLVFVPKNAMPYTTETFSKFNRDEKKSQSNLEQAVKASKTASAETISKLADIVSRFDKLSDLYASEKATTDIINTLLDTGVIMQNEVARLKNGNLLSQEGKSFLENIMLGSVLNEDSLRKTNSMLSVRQSLMRIMPQLLNNAKLRDYSLQNELNNAISLLYDAHKTGNDVNLQLMQTNLFEASPAEIYNEVEKLLANALQKEKDTDLRAIFEAYNNEALNAEAGQTDMFEGILTKPELLSKILKHYGQRQESGTEQASNTTASNSQSSGQKQPTGQRPAERPRRSIDELNNAFDNSSSPQERAEIARELNQEYNSLFGTEDAVDVYEKVEDFVEAFTKRVREVYPQNAERHISELKEDLAKGYKFSGVEVGGRILVNTSHIATANDLNRTWLHEQAHIADSKAFTPEQKENANIPEINNFIPEVYHSNNNRVKFSEAIAFAVERLLDNHTMEQIATGEADLSGIHNNIKPYVEQTLNKLTNGRRKTDTDRRHDETAHNATKSSSKRVRQKEKTGNGHSTTTTTTETDRGGTQQQAKSKEQQELEDLLKGLADDLGIEDVRFRKDGEITPPSTAAIEKVLKINSLLVKQGKVGYEDYARVFINAMGDNIKPYLQGFYFLAKGANPSVKGFNSLSEVEKIDLDKINREEKTAAKSDQSPDAGKKVDAKPLSFNRWRHTWTSTGNVSIFPYLVGEKFADAQVKEIEEWAKNNGFVINEAKDTVIRLLLPTKGMDRIEAEERLTANNIQKVFDQQIQDERDKQHAKRKDKEERAKQRDSHQWIIDNFGQDIMNGYNMNALSDVLEGVTDKFNGQVNYKWLDGIKTLNAFTADGKGVNFKKLKELYNKYKSAQEENKENPQTNDQGSLLNNKEQDNLKDKGDVSNRPTNSESGSKQQPDKIQPDVSSVQPDGRRNGETRGGDEAVTGESGRPIDSPAGSGLFPNLSGEPSNNGSNKQDRTTQPSQRDARDTESGRTKDGDIGGLSDSIDQSDRKSTRPDSSHGKKSESFEERTKRRIEQQKTAESIPVKLMDEANIRETLPLLLPEQQDDVIKAEKRFFSDEHNTPEKAIGKGFLFTNGTGTGKTFTGLGIAKRFDKQGKKNILIVVPSQAKVADWRRDGEMIGLNITPLLDTADGGEGAVVTTYANFRANESLRARDLDLLIFDESHRILEEKSGKESSTFHQYQQQSNVSPQIAFRRLQSVHPVWKEIQDLTDQIYNIESLMSDLDMMDWKYANNSKTRDDLQKQRDALQERWNNEIEPELQERAEKAYRNSKVVLLSATPFKGHFNLKYANKVLFDWGDQETVNSRGSRVNPEAQFYLNNFGSAYEWKYHRLQSKSDANAEAIAMQEVEFAEKLKRDGVMSGRAIESDMDYSREFPLVTLEKSDMFNSAYEYLTTKVPEELRDVVKAVLQDYNYSTRLFESLRASMAIPRIQAHLDMNRKVVVFHRRRVSNVEPPFATIIKVAEQTITSLEEGIRAGQVKGIDVSDQIKTLKEIRESVDHFKKEFGELLAWEQTLNYDSALDQIEAAFPGKVLAINGSTKKSDKEKAPAIFNDSNSGKDIIVIQEEAGKEGISLHDKGGDRQRALISLSLPQATTTTLQIEGRIFRIGQESNAIFEYPLLGLDLELERFGNDINKRLSTTENLSMGEASRDLLRSFAEGVLFQSSADAPHDGQGIGGKEFDKKAQSDTTPFRKAVLTYHTNQKERGSRDQREGTDFFATPEPIGFKMVEWAQLKPQETALEPSAGNGAIAMHFPKNVSTTVIEPSPSLYSRLMLRAGSSGDVQGRNIKFEDHHIVNKYDAVAMNPPFGVGGKTAMEHLEKGLNHLKEGGRLIAIIPRGRMDKRLDDFLNETNKAGRKVNGHFHLRGEMTLPSVTFEQAGTSVSTRIVVIDRLEVPTVEKIANKILETNRHKNIISGGGIARMSAEEINSAAERIHEDIMEKINARSSYSMNETKDISDVFNSIEFTPMVARLEALDNSEAIREASGDVSKWMDSQTGKNENYIKTFEQKHSQTGNVMYMAKPEAQLSREDYTRIKDIARRHNGFWSRYSNEAEGIQAGFVFKEAEDAQKFAKSASKYLSEKEDSPRFRKLEEAISTPQEDITNRVAKEGDIKQEEFGNGRINAEPVNPQEHFGKIKEKANYREDGTTYVADPIINIYNVNASLYKLGALLKPVHDLHSEGLLKLRKGTGYFNNDKVKEFSDRFPEAISEYEEALKKTMLLSTDAAQKEILDILSDIDYAKDYYNRLAEGEDVFRIEDEPRFRKEAKQIKEVKNGLVVLHNMSENNFLTTAKNGRMPMPSIAITKPDISFTGYGEITLIGKKELIDPQADKRNKVYSADAYTTRYPNVIYEVKNDKALINYTKDLPKEFTGAGYDITSSIKDGGLDRLKQSRYVQYMFLKEQGVDITVNKEAPQSKEVIDVVRSIGAYDWYHVENKEAVRKTLSSIFLSELDDEKRNNEFLMNRLYLSEDGLVNEHFIKDMYNTSSQYIRETDRGDLVDEYKTLNEARERVVDHNSDTGYVKGYPEYVGILYDNLDVESKIFDGYTPSGRRRDVENTPENALKIMLKDKGRGKEGAGGFGQAVALQSRQFKTTTAIKNDQERLTDHDKYKEAKDRVQEKYTEFADAIRDNYKYTGWGYLEAIASELSSLARNGQSDSFSKISKEAQGKAKDLLQTLKTIPVMYFEAKPERIVYMNEFASAVIPFDISQEVKEALDRAGINYREYSDADSRIDAVKQISKDMDLRFRKSNAEMSEIKTQAIADGTFMKAPNGKPTNLNEKQWLQTRTKAFKEWFGDWQNNPDEASKVVDENGEPMVVYHGSPSMFNIFDREKSITQPSGLREFTNAFTDNINLAELYSNKKILDGEVSSPTIYGVFLNIKNMPEFDGKGKEWSEARFEVKVDLGYKIAKGIDAIEALAGKNSMKPNIKTDGFKLSNVIEGTKIGNDMLGNSYHVFSPTQIKSATDNDGSFDSENEDIRYRKDNPKIDIKPLDYKLDNDYVDYYVRFSDHIEEDMERGWSSWNFGQEGFDGTEAELNQAISEVDDTNPLWISGFDMYPDDLKYADIRELYKDYWVVVDNTNAINGLSAHYISEKADTLGDLLKQVKENSSYNGWGDGESFDSEYSKVIYSDGNMHIVQVGGIDEDIIYRKAESLMDNLDNAEKVIENYNNVLSDVFNNSQKKAEILNKAKANGMNLKHAIESYIAEDATLDEVEAIAKEIGADIPDNALRYVFWRNANPNDGTMVWKAKNAIAEREYKEDVLFRKSGPVRSDALEEYERKVRGARGFKKAGSLDGILFGIEEGWFDRMASLRILQDVIVGKGNEIPTGRNAYLLENQMSSKNVAQIEHYQQKYLDPMIKEAGELFDHNATEIDYYLIAKHGLERNRVMAEQEVERQSAKERADAEQLLAEGFLSQEDYDKAIAKLDEKDKKKLEKLLESKDYSGLTALYNLLEDNPLEYSSGVKDRIQRYVEEVESTKDTAKLWELINASTKYMLKRQFDSGYMSRENYEKIRDMYEHYVPLRGFDETTATDIYDYIENKPSNFNKLLKKAHGRKSLSVSPFISLMSMAQSGVMEVNRNDMKKAFYRLVATNPSALATIKDVWYVESEDGEWNERHPDIPENATGEEVARIVEGFEAEMQELKAKDKAKRGRNDLDVGVKIHKAQASEHAVKLWVNGEEKVIYINGSPRAAQAINGLTNSASKERGDLMRTAQFWMRQMSANFTSRNPEFLVTNMQRDVNFAVTSAAIKEGPAYAAKLSANLAKVGKTIAKEIYGKGGGKYGELWEEFTWNGGETGYAILHSEDTNRKYMNNKLREFSNRKDIIKPVRIWINQIENANRLIEANTRFATYVTSREMGRSIEQSIANAKDITVNFNRKGAGTYWADVIHGLYLFSNPALQSMRQMGLMAKKNPVRFGAAAAITTLGGFMMPLLNQLLINMFGDDGDDELYRNLSDWTKQNHMVMYIPGTKDKFMSFALSHELRGFHGMGALAYEAINGNLKGKNVPLEILGQFADNLPLDPTGGRSSLSPDVLKPIVEAYYTNTNFMDRPIYKKNPWNENAPEWTKAYKKTYPELVEFTKFLNELTGGDDVVAGAVNLNPARMEHVFKGYVGGAWTTYSDAISQLYGLITGDEESQNLFNIPITRKIVKTSDEFNKELRINSEYFYWLDWMKEYERVQRGYLKIATTPDREADRDKYINKYMGTFGETPTHMYNRLKRMSEAIKKVEDSGSDKDAMKMKADLIDYMWELEAKAKQED